MKPMIKNFLSREKKENFLIVSFLENKLEATTICADFINKDLEINKILETNLEDNLNILKRIFSNVFHSRPYKVILSFSHQLAVTNFSQVTVFRDNPKQTINEAELENLISRAVFNFFGQTRKYASSRLNIGEVEALICDVRIYDVSLDNHPVLDLLKEKGKKLDFYISETFCRRDFLKEIISFLPKRASVAFVAEGGSSLTHLISRYFEKPFLFAKVGSEETSLFLRTKENKINYIESFKWGLNSLYLAIAKEFNFNLETAKLILNRYLEGTTSSTFRRKLQFFLKKELALLGKGLEIINSNIKSKNLIIDLPPSLAKFLKIKNISANSIKSIDTKIILDAFNFKLKTLYVWEDLYGAAVFLESYFSPQENLLNKLAKRRIRWLIP